MIDEFPNNEFMEDYDYNQYLFGQKVSSIKP